MQLTRDALQNIHRLSDEVAAAKDRFEEATRTAQDRHKDREVEIERGGKTIMLAEKILWDELFHLGLESQAGLKLKALHPDVFTNMAEQNAKAAELKEFVIATLGVNYTQMNLSDYLHVTEQLYLVLADERKNT